MTDIPSSVHIHKGLLNLPGITYESTKVAEDVLTKDHKTNHCYFRPSGFHNHLSHHILAVYDMGATPELIKSVFEDEQKIQRAIVPEEPYNFISASCLPNGVAERGYSSVLSP